MRVNPWLNHGTLRAAFAEVFSLDPVRVEVTDDVAMLTGRPIPPEPRILLECFKQEGLFPLQLDVFLAGDKVEQPVADLIGTLTRAQELARRLDATLLFGTGPIGYDEQIRVAPDGSIDIVQLDWDDEDEDKFTILGSRPFTELPADSDRPAEAARAPA